MPFQSSYLSHHHPFPLHCCCPIPPTWECYYHHCKMSTAERAKGTPFIYTHTHTYTFTHILTHTYSLWKLHEWIQAMNMLSFNISPSSHTYDWSGFWYTKSYGGFILGESYLLSLALTHSDNLYIAIKCFAVWGSGSPGVLIKAKDTYVASKSWQLNGLHVKLNLEN